MKTLLLATALSLITVQAQDPPSFQDPDVRLTWGWLGWGRRGSVVSPDPPQAMVRESRTIQSQKDLHLVASTLEHEDGAEGMY